MRKRNSAAHGAVTPGGPTGIEVRQLMSDSTNHGLRVALYPRVSGEKQVKEGYGLDYQESQLRQYAEVQSYRVVEVVRDEAFQRTEFHRPGLDRLRALAQAGEIDAVLAWKRDRYFGAPGLRAMFEYEMEQYGVRLLAMDDSGGERPEDKFSDGIKDLLAQLEVAKTRERTRSGVIQKARSGKVIIGRSINYGFRVNERRDNYEVDEATAPIMRRIFEMVASGTSLKAVTQTLNREAIPSPTKALWGTNSVRKMLLDDVYRPHTVRELRAIGVAESVLASLDKDKLYGVWYYGRRSVKRWREPGTYQKRSKVVHNDPSEWLPVPVPDIGIPREVVDAARERIKHNVRSSRASKRVWELDSGIFRCGVCGWRMVPRTAGKTNKQYHYVCSSYTRPEKRHQGVPHFFNAAKSEAEVARRVDSYFDNPEKMTRYIQERVEQERAKLFSGDADAHAKALTGRLAKLETMREKLSEQHMHGVITIAKLKDKLAGLDEQERAARSELDSLADRQAHIERIEQEAKYALDFFAATVSAEGLESLTPEMRREMYKRMNLTVIANPDRTLTIEAIPDTNYLPVVEVARQEVSEVRNNRLMLG